MNVRRVSKTAGDRLYVGKGRNSGLEVAPLLFPNFTGRDAGRQQEARPRRVGLSSTVSDGRRRHEMSAISHSRGAVARLSTECLCTFEKRGAQTVRSNPKHGDLFLEAVDPTPAAFHNRRHATHQRPSSHALQPDPRRGGMARQGEGGRHGSREVRIC